MDSSGLGDVVKRKAFRHLEVFGKRVPVYLINGLMDEGFFGYFSPDAMEVGVDSKLKGEMLEQTILHELFHAVLIRLFCQQQLSPEFAEVIVESLATSVIDNYKVKAKVL